MARYCENCGVAIESSTSKYCTQCGRQITHEDVPDDVSKQKSAPSGGKYAIEERLNSGQWNSFFVSAADYDDYISEGNKIPPGGIFSFLSKDKRSNNKRRIARLQSLLKTSHRHVNDAYRKYKTEGADKYVASYIVERTKGAFDRKLSHVFSDTKNDAGWVQYFNGIVEQEKRFSGEIVSFYPAKRIDVGGKSFFSGLVYLTTRGLSFIPFENDSSLRALPAATAQAVVPGFGALAIGAAVGTAHLLASKAVQHKLNKRQRRIDEAVRKCAPSLVAASFGGQFAPFEKINFMTWYPPGKQGALFLVFFDNERSAEMILEAGDASDLIARLSAGDRAKEPQYSGGDRDTSYQIKIN